jgi:hypothetical protein
MSKVENSLSELSRQLRDGISNRVESTPLGSNTQPRSIELTPDKMDDYSLTKTKRDSVEVSRQVGYPPRTSPGDVPHNSGQRPFGGSTTLEGGQPRAPNVHNDLQSTSRDMRALRYAGSIQTKDKKGARKYSDSIDSMGKSLSSIPDAECDINLTLDPTPGLPSNSSKLTGPSIVNALNPGARNKRYRDVNIDAETNPRATKVNVGEKVVYPQSRLVPHSRKLRNIHGEPKTRPWRREGRDSQTQPHQDGMGSCSNLREGSSTGFASDSYDGFETEGDDPQEDRTSTITLSRLAKTVQLLREWVGNKGNSKILAVQQRLLYSRHLLVVIHALILLSMLCILTFLLAPTNSIPSYLGAFLLLLGLIAGQMSSEKSSRGSFSNPVPNSVSAHS